MAPLLEAKNLIKHFPAKVDVLGRAHAWVHAVDNVSLSLEAGESAEWSVWTGSFMHRRSLLEPNYKLPASGGYKSNLARISVPHGSDIRTICNSEPNNNFQFRSATEESATTESVSITEICGDPVLH